MLRNESHFPDKHLRREDERTEEQQDTRLHPGVFALSNIVNGVV